MNSEAISVPSWVTRDFPTTDPADWTLRDKAWIHATAKVSLKATLGMGVVVGPHSYVAKRCVVGDWSKINEFVQIRRDVEIGRQNTIRYGAKLCNYVRTGDGVTVGIRASLMKGVSLESGVVIGNKTIVHQHSTIGYKTTVGRGSLFCSYSQVGEFSKLGANCKLGYKAVIHSVGRLNNGAIVWSYTNRPKLKTGQPQRR